MDHEPSDMNTHLFHRDFSDIEKLAALGELLAGLAHELNSPISSIIGFSEMLQAQPLDKKSHDRYIQNIHGAAVRASKIIEGLLLLLKQQKQSFTPILVNNVIRKTVPLFDYQLRAKKVDLVLDLASGLPFVQADFHRLQQVVFNLMMNSIQALEQWGGERRLTVSTAARGDSIEISVQDTGPGIPPAQADTIFTPFFTTKQHGTGLGLSIVQSIVVEHGGTIALKPQAAGCCITVTLPVGQQVVALSTFGETPQPERPAPRVLIVDDDEFVVDTFCGMMEHMGYHVTFATSGPAALAALSHSSFALIFVDYRMPGMDGITFIQEALKRIKEQHIILMTGDPFFDPADVLKDMTVPVLRKPFALDDLRAILDNFLPREN
ncbi:MAG TPA: ATP-binding protein [Dissulfurispiraceae bacterium]|nr:ATP-binding protein [Dissulfurispiraceae bacterium]